MRRRADEAGPSEEEPFPAMPIARTTALARLAGMVQVLAETFGAELGVREDEVDVGKPPPA